VDTITHLTNQLVASYAKVGGINHLDGKNLPSKRAVAALTVDLLRLLFPGFFDEKAIHSSEIRVETAALLDAVLGPLEDEIRKSLEYLPPAGLAKKDIHGEAHKLTVELLGKLPDLREILQTDMQAAYDGDPAASSKDEVLVAYPFVEAIAVQRLAHELFLKQVPLIPRIMAEWAHARTGMELHPGATNRILFLCGPLHGHRGGRDLRNWQPCEDVPRCDAGRQIHRRRPTTARQETASHHRGSRNDLPRRHDFGRRHRHWGRQHHRRQRVPHGECAAEFAGDL
jgi:hypothetical protein